MGLVLPAALRRSIPAGMIDPLRRILWMLPNLRRRLPSGLDLVVADPADWVLYNDIFAEGEYDEVIRAALQAAPPGRPLRVLDLGANVGYFSLRLADLALRGGKVDFRITAVEASPRLVRQLQRRLRSQDGLGSRLEVVCGLAGRRVGHGELFESPHHFASSVIPPRAGRRIRGEYVDLAALTADWPAVDLLKCDVEGSELELAETYVGDLLPRVRMMAVELHHELCDAERCLALLSDAGLAFRSVLREAHGCSLVLLAQKDLP